MSGEDIIQVGIVGFGRIGNEHAEWLSKTRMIQAMAVVDATPARQKLAESRGLRIYAELDKLLDDRSIDAVLVATPTAMHFEHASQVIEAGKHVLVEKPMALDLPQSQRLVELAKEKGRVISVFQNRRWDRDYLTVKKHLDAGVFGKVINVESRLGQWASCVGPAAREYRPGWRNEAAFGGGGLYDWGSHFVDQMWRLMTPAKPARVFAQLRGNVWTRDCDDFARVCIDFDNGAATMVEINTTTTRPLPRWHIDGTKGSADAPFSLEFDVEKWAKLEFRPCEPGAEPLVLPMAEKGLNEVDIWEQFAAAVRGEAEPAVDAQSVLVTMQLLDAARKSSAEGRVVEIP